jgi:hypothetical protein
VYFKIEDDKLTIMKTAIRLDPELWESCKKEAVQTMGKFSARAMQYAVSLYKKQGGTYAGPKSPKNSLTLWTKEDWGYVGKEKHSRYLPEKAKEHLTRGEKIATDRAKNAGTKAHKQWVAQPKKIAEKTAKYRAK